MFLFSAAVLADEITLAAIVGYITTILTTALTWVSSVAAVVTGSPLIMFFVLLGGIYIGVNMLRKLLHI